MYGLTILDAYDTGPVGSLPLPPLIVDIAPVIEGTATIADGRALSGATVEALPLHCPPGVGTDAGPSLPDSPSCMPRHNWTTTSEPKGAFALALDPGDYWLRVQPVDGTRLPWVTKTIHVPGSLPVTFTIPAPVFRGLQLFDGLNGFAVGNAVVRTFSIPPQGPAVEVGRTITDANGRFDMYIDPAMQ
jgi:hypothetical protein